MEPQFPACWPQFRPAGRLAAAEWLRRSDLDGNLERFFIPNLDGAGKKSGRNRGLDSGHSLSVVSADPYLIDEGRENRLYLASASRLDQFQEAQHTFIV